MPFLSMVRSALVETRRRIQRFSLSTQKRRDCKLGRKRRLVLLFACETLLPTIGPLPVTWHTRAMVIPLQLCRVLKKTCQAQNLNLPPNLPPLLLSMPWQSIYQAGHKPEKPCILICNRQFDQAALSSMRPNSHDRQAHKASRLVRGRGVGDCQALTASPALAPHIICKVPIMADATPRRLPCSLSASAAA